MSSEPVAGAVQRYQTERRTGSPRSDAANVVEPRTMPRHDVSARAAEERSLSGGVPNVQLEPPLIAVSVVVSLPTLPEPSVARTSSSYRPAARGFHVNAYG